MKREEVMSFRGLDDRKEVVALLKNLKEELPALEELLAACGDHWGYEDPVYRFYHQSYNLYGLQSQTLEIVERLKA
jgi:hypothetical protein